MTTNIFTLTTLALLIIVTAGGIAMADVPETPEFLLHLADEAFNDFDFAKAAELYERARVHAQDAGNNSVQTEATAQRARCYLTQNMFDSAKVWLEKAEAIADPDQGSGWARFLGVKGRWQWRNGENAEALATFAQMYEYANVRDLAKHQIDAARMAAIVAPLEEQEEWALKGIRKAEVAGEDKYLGPLWNNLGGTYSDLKRFDDAVEAYKNARDYHWRFGNQVNKFWADYGVGYALRLAGEHDEAIAWLSPCLAWAERMGDHSAIGHTSEQLGEIAAARGDTARAVGYFESALVHLKAAGYAEHSGELLTSLEKRIQELQ